MNGMMVFGGASSIRFSVFRSVGAFLFLASEIGTSIFSRIKDRYPLLVRLSYWNISGCRISRRFSNIFASYTYPNVCLSHVDKMLNTALIDSFYCDKKIFFNG